MTIADGPELCRTERKAELLHDNAQSYDERPAPAGVHTQPTAHGPGPDSSKSTASPSSPNDPGAPGAGECLTTQVAGLVQRSRATET